MTIYTATADDLYTRSDGPFNDTTTTFKFGRTSAPYIQNSYIPFPVNDIAQSTVIESAIFRMVETGGTNTTCKLKYGVASNGAKPTSVADLAAKTFVTGSATDDAFPANSAGTVHELDVTASVQAKINAGWTPPGPGVPGDLDIIAILLFDNVSSTNADRTFAATENTTYDPPTLEITFPSFVPIINFN